MKRRKNKLRILKEKIVVRRMIQIYCQHHHSTTNKKVCEECFSLYLYACYRLDRCPFGSQKGICKNCTIHCYKPDMRQQIRQVMRYSGPRMLWHHPISALRHFIREVRPQ